MAAVAALAAVAGISAPRHPRPAVATLVGLGVVAALAARGRPGAGALDAAPSLLAAAVGALTLLLLRRAWLRAFTAPRPAHRPAGGPTPATGARTQPALPPETDRAETDRAGTGTDRVETGPATQAQTPRAADRRTLLLTGAATLGLATFSGGAGRVITGARDSAAGGAGLVLPRPADPAAPLPSGSDLRIAGLSPYTTPTADFYRVDTALIIPRVPHRDWRLRIHGLVDRPVELTFDDLLARPLAERDITLTCVSNEVGGPYAGHARWLGVDLAALLRQAGVRSGADQILSRSADGWTCATPVETVLDGRDALLAVGMNGQVLPPVHGFPARMIVPGLYGYVSATKWVTDLKLTRFADEPAYWTVRGWAERAPIKTASRIDVPKAFARLPAGRLTVAGVAWAQHRGVDAVEVRIDGGPWHQARLAPSANADTWRQWHLDWQVAPGEHRLEVRATDATGHTQPSQRVTPFPDGATGWHSVVVTVR